MSSGVPRSVLCLPVIRFSVLSDSCKFVFVLSVRSQYGFSVSSHGAVAMSEGGLAFIHLGGCSGSDSFMGATSCDDGGGSLFSFASLDSPSYSLSAWTTAAAEWSWHATLVDSWSSRLWFIGTLDAMSSFRNGEAWVIAMACSFTDI